MAEKRCSPGLDDRCRDQNGRIRQKNGSSEIGTLRDRRAEAEFRECVAAGLRSNSARGY